MGRPLRVVVGGGRLLWMAGRHLGRPLRVVVGGGRLYGWRVDTWVDPYASWLVVDVHNGCDGGPGHTEAGRFSGARDGSIE